MHPIRINRERNIGMIVDDEQGAGIPCDSNERQGGFVNRPPCAVLAPILKKPHACGNSLNHGLLRADPKDLLIKDQAEPVQIRLPGYCSAP